MRYAAFLTLSLVGVFSIFGCSSGDKDGPIKNKDVSNVDKDFGTKDSSLPKDVTDALDLPKFQLSTELANSLSYMGNEERLAYDVYNELYKKFGTKQFTNIATKSEYKHINAVRSVIKKYGLNDGKSFTNIDLEPLGYHDTAIEEMEAGTYDISKIQGLYTQLIAMGSKSEIDALKVGCIIEVVDINDLDKYLALAKESKADDVEVVFNFLRDGSYNHYWAFDKGLKKKGESQGCCVLGVIDGVDYCHPEYPKK